MSFDARSVPARPKTPLSRALVSLNLAVAAAMLLSGAAPFSPSSSALVEWGANFAPLTLSGEYWRLLTSAFVHVGLLHLAFNLWVLWTYGPIVEFLLGRKAFLGLYLGTALVSAATSAAWNPVVVSAGASGALFGLVGAMIGFLGKASRRDPALKAHVGSLMAFVGYNVLFGLIVSGIDNAAHFGGLAAGLVFGWILRPGRRLGRGVLTAGAFCVLALGAAGIALIGASRVDPLAGRMELIAFEAREGHVQKAAESARALARSHPENAKVRALTGYLALRSAQWKEAEDEFRSVARLDPGHRDLAKLLAMALAGQGKVTEALELLEEAARREPENQELGELLQELRAGADKAK